MPEVNTQENLVILSQVNNEVLEVNPNVFMPLRLEKGKSSPLGVFAEEMLRNKPDSPLEGKVIGEFLPAHNRSMLIGKVFFRDIEGRLYRDIDIKGSGWVMNYGVSNPPRVFTPGKSRFTEGTVVGSSPHGGLLDRDVAFHDYLTAEELLKIGVRTYRGLAIIELKELIANGSKRAVQDLKKKGLIDEDFNPVIEVRAFGTKIRIEDRTPQLLEDAKNLVSRELGINFPSDEDYFRWFAEELGKSVGLLHKNGLSHNFLGTGHNITLDCRIVDLDTVRPLTSEKHRKQDTQNAAFLVSQLSPDEKKHVSEWMNEPLARIFYKGYNRTFPAQERKGKLRFSTVNR